MIGLVYNIINYIIAVHLFYITISYNKNVKQNTIIFPLILFHCHKYNSMHMW